jgi:hypothetical protein
LLAGRHGGAPWFDFSHSPAGALKDFCHARS